MKREDERLLLDTLQSLHAALEKLNDETLSFSANSKHHNVQADLRVVDSGIKVLRSRWAQA